MARGRGPRLGRRDSLRTVLGVVTQARSQLANGDWQVSKFSLAMGQAGPAGWIDIVVTNTEKQGGRPTQRWTYRYDGKTYGLNTKPAPFWSDYCCALSW